jgi:hypothetical protein
LSSRFINKCTQVYQPNQEKVAVWSSPYDILLFCPRFIPLKMIAFSGNISYFYKSYWKRRRAITWQARVGQHLRLNAIAFIKLKRIIAPEFSHLKGVFSSA